MTAGAVGATLTANTTGFQAAMNDAAAVGERTAKRIVGFMDMASKATREQEAATKKMAASAKKDFGAVEEAGKRVQEGSHGVGRELIVLAHEMSQGNYQRFGGSMLVLAERMNLLEKATSLSGAATIGFGVAVIGVVAEIAAGGIEADRFAKALQLTGNYAATSAEAVRQLAAAQSLQTGRTAGASRETVQAVAGSGLFGPAALGPVSRAMADFQKLSGATADEALKEFSRLAEEPAKVSAEWNRSMHFMSLASYEQVKALEQAGDKQQAMIVAVNALSGTLESRGTPAVGSFARAWQWVKDAASGAGEALRDIGAGSDEAAKHLTDIERQMKVPLLNRAAGWSDANGGFSTPNDRYMTDLAGQRAAILQRQFQQQERAAAAAQAAQDAVEGQKAKDYTDEILRQAKAMSARTLELKKFHDAVEAQARAGSPMSAADIAAGEADINKRFTDHSGDARATEYASLTARIKEFNAETAEQLSRLAPLTEGQKFLLKVEQDLASSANKLTAAEKAGALADAQKAAAARDVADAELRAQKATLARIQADTANQQAQQALVEGVVQAGDEQANSILRQAQLIGKSADEVTRIQALQQFDGIVSKALLGADGDTVKRIQDVAATLRGDLVDALDQAKAAQDAYNASFSAGMDKAMADYTKQAANAAAFGEKVFTDATQGMTDALTQFAMTGKLSFKGLIDSMIADLLRYEIQKGISGFLGGGADFGAFGSMVGDALDFFPTFANGLDYVPYDGFTARLHEGEEVVRKQDARGGRASNAPTIYMPITQHIGDGVTRAEVYAAAKQATAESTAHLVRQLRTGKLVGA